MGIVTTVLRWIYQILAALCAVCVALLSSSIAFGLPFKRADLVLAMDQWAANPLTKLLIGLGAVAILAIFFAYIYFKSKIARAEPSIAFDNPDGEVSISIRAIEDFVGRVGKDFAEVKSLEPSVIARREGVQISLRVELWSGPNIPKLTERIQNVIKSQVQNIIGIENVQSITLNVSKILSQDGNFHMPAQSDIFAGSTGSEGSTQPPPINVPYQS